MSLIRLYKKESFFSLCLFLSPFLIPIFGISNVGTLVTPITALFAIVAGFFIADAMANYLRLQTLISEENSALIALATAAKRVDKKNYSRVHRTIDRYMIAQLDLRRLDHILKTQNEMNDLGAAIDSLRAGPDNRGYYEHLFDLREKMHLTRQEIMLTTKKTLSVIHWFTLLLFGGLMLTTVLALRDESILMNVVAGLMNVGTFALLILLRDIDNNRLLEEKLAYQNPREIFHSISKPPYYPSFSPIAIRLPDETGFYRVGKGLGKRGKAYDLVSVNK